jgi:hypothetical protein
MKFKKSLAALLAAVMVIGMVSCGTASDSDDDDEDEVTSSAAAEDTESEDGTEEENSEESEEAAESEAESEEADETEESAADESEDSADDSESSDTGYADGVFTGDNYTISVDESLWEYSEQASTDCAFVYIGEGDDLAATANLNIVSMTADALAGNSPSEYADSIKEAFDSMDGYTITADEEGELNGYETYNLTIEYEISDYTMVINQVIVANDSTLVAISYGAFDSVLDDIQPEFDKVLSTFTFNS